MRTPMSRTALAVVLTALLLSLLPASSAQAQSKEKYRQQARVVTNNARDNHDLAKLQKHTCVQKFARRQAVKMANQEKLFHQDLGVVLNRCDLSGVGENVAYGYPTGRAAVKAWLKSPGHRANLLEPSYRMLGMAVRRSKDGTPYAVQVFGRR